ncbi:quinone oxidoreductase-like protein 1 isoform X1 [Chiloscyllium plagiosum]|uniref:quinone oxidoreductase-like protein 1 isoform X1 n=2 Tax=Chiloscyllium plagiosum TaxID=36176 RepID=UPI001CB7CD5F|nr:quinone oxidoreductase-like protein 1 isoform X1 [Chiloscyllium plagiosum]
MNELGLKMKGLYCHLAELNEDVKFVFQDKESVPSVYDHYVKLQVKVCAFSPLNIKLLMELKLQEDFLPIGREVAGVVLEVGPKVSFFKPNDEVVGILPLDCKESGLSNTLLVHEHSLVKKPENVSWVDAAGTICDGLRAYMALHTHTHVSAGTTVLVMEGANPFGTIVIQLAHHRGAKVISTASTVEDKMYLEGLRPTVGIRQPLVARVVNLYDGKIDLVDSCLEETGGLGVNIVIDCGVQLYSKEDEPVAKQHLPHKHDILSLLSVGGHWVTTVENLQLDPPDSQFLFRKAATISFLNEEVWQLSNMHQGKYLHILKDVMEKLSCGTFRPQLDEPIPIYEASVAMEMVQKKQVKKKQVVRL